MMDQEAVLAKLKKDVRSLLIPMKVGQDPDRLRQDYFTMLGHPMPLKLLGFRDIMDMVNEMPDVVSVHYRMDGSPFLKAVSDDSTQNIEALVAEQQLSKTEKKFKRGGYSSHHYRPMSRSLVLPRRGRAPPPLPAQLRAQLRILLSQGPIRLSELERAYLCCYGHPLRIRNFGFFSTGEMLEAAADLVTIQQSRFGSLVTLRQHWLPRPLLTPSSAMRRTGQIKAGSPKANKPTIKKAQLKVEMPKKSPVNESLQNQPSTENTMDPLHNDLLTINGKPEKVNMNQETIPELCQEGQLFHKRVLKLEEELRQRIVENGVAGTISQELKDKLRKVVAQMTDGLLVYDLPTEYKRLFGEDLPLAQSGFVNVAELVDAMSDTFHLKPAEGDNGHHWIIMNIQDSDTQTDLKEVKDFNDDMRSTSKSHYISCGQSPWEGQLEGDDSTAPDDETEQLETNYISKTKEMMLETYCGILVHSSPTVPPDALQSQRLKPPTHRKARELVAVVLEQVESPGHFYIRFSESEETRAMEDMMIDMRRCYTCPKMSKRYRLPEQFVRQGQVCCVSPGGMWFYRVVIHRIISPIHVEVYYVDFGDVTVVQKANLKFLRSGYSVLPAQAVPSSLAGITPTTGSWTAQAVASFKTLCSVRTLVGALNGYTDDVLQLYLCDTRTDEDIYIHNVLLNQGHGTACSSATSTVVTPMRLYLGKGMIPLPDVDQRLLCSPKPAETPEESMAATLKDEDDEEDEMPDLELIEDSEVKPHTQFNDTNPFSALLNDQNLNCGELGRPLTSPTATSSALPGPHLTQTKMAPVHCKADLKTLGMTPQPTQPSIYSCSGDPTPEEVDDRPTAGLYKPPPILRTLTLHTPHLGQIHESTPGVPRFSLCVHSSGVMFPLFGTRYARTTLALTAQTQAAKDLGQR